MKPKRPCESVPGNALVLAGLANFRLADKPETILPDRRHFASCNRGFAIYGRKREKRQEA
jgi:hypothetical protein